MIKNGRFGIYMIIVSLFLFSFPSIFSAHAYIQKSSPVEGSILEKAPNEVTIQFDEPIQSAFHSIQVFDSEGKRVDKGKGGIDPDQPTVLKSELKKNLPKGAYRIKWKVVSSDGHPVEGVIAFQIGNEGQNATVIQQDTRGYTPKTDLVTIRWLQYFGYACYAGLIFFYLVVTPKGFQEKRTAHRLFLKLFTIGLGLLYFSILLSLPLQATIESGNSWSEIFNSQLLSTILADTAFGQAWFFQLGLLIVLTFITLYMYRAKSTNRIILWTCFTLGAGLLLAKAFTSHAAAQRNQPLSIVIDFLHLFAATIWLGCLIGFVAILLLRKHLDSKEDYLQMIKRFSKWGILLVVLLTLTGLFNSQLFIPNLESLTRTNYGMAFSIKVALFLIMLLFAAINFLNGKNKRMKGLLISLGGELSIGLVILMLTVVLTNLPTAMQSPGPFKETSKLHQGNRITLRITPNIIGENLFEVNLKDQHGKPFKDIEQLNLTFSMLDMDMGKETVRLEMAGEGKYTVKGLHFSMAGKWNVHVHGLTKSLESIDTDFKVLVGSQ